MSKLGTHTNPGPTGLGDFLKRTAAAHSPVPALFALDIDVAPDVRAHSPQTKIVFRTQKFGPDTGRMYQGDAHTSGYEWINTCWPIWQLNQADWYAPINEPGRSDRAGLEWLAAFFAGCLDRADELGVKLCVGEWSAGMPPLEHLDLLTPLFRRCAAGGHLLGLHEYSLTGPMVPSVYCLRYRDLLAALPADARPLILISEAGPGGGYNTGYVGQEYLDVVAAYDAEVMRDAGVLGVALFKLGRGESDMANLMPALTQYVIDHPTPIEPPPPDDEWIFDHVIINGLEYITPEFSYICGVGDNVIEFVFRKKGMAEPCTLVVSTNPPELITRILQTPPGGVFRVGDAVTFKVLP